MTEERVDRVALPLLFDPIRIGGRTARNRIHMPSMHTGFADAEGRVTPRLLAYLEARVGGVGMVTLEQATVHASGRRTSTNQLIFWDDSFIPGVRRVADLAHQHGALALIQLSHAGRQTSAKVVGAQPVAPSAVTCESYPVPPRVLEADEIPAIQEHFVTAAERAREAGLDGVELHAGHGFLMAQFLSPYFNRREDEYGGDPRRRARFVTEVIGRIRQRLGPGFIIQLRMSIVEGIEGGLTVEESQRLGVLFQQVGLDALHCSAGMTFNRYLYCAPIGVEHGHNLPLAAAMKSVLSIPVIAAGRLHDPLLAEAALRDGKADMISIGRGLICDPDLPAKAARGDLGGVRPCVGCNEGCGARPAGCMLNVQAGHELEWFVEPAPVRLSVLVVGGGPAGLEAARVAASRGHRVSLIEREDHLGGQFALGAVPPGKGELLSWIRWMERELRRLGVAVSLGEALDAATIQRLAPDRVVVATGGEPLRPPIPGLDGESVVSAVDVLAGRAQPGREVVVIGGGETGCETADYLAASGRQVTIVEMLPTVARDVGREQRHYLLSRLRAGNVRLLPSTRVTRFSPGEVLADALEGQLALKADTVVLAVGVRPLRSLAEELAITGVDAVTIGDAERPGNAVDAIRQGFLAGRNV